MTKTVLEIIKDHAEAAISELETIGHDKTAVMFFGLTICEDDFVDVSVRGNCDLATATQSISVALISKQAEELGGGLEAKSSALWPILQQLTQEKNDADGFTILLTHRDSEGLAIAHGNSENNAALMEAITGGLQEGDEPEPMAPVTERRVLN